MVYEQVSRRGNGLTQDQVGLLEALERQRTPLTETQEGQLAALAMYASQIEQERISLLRQPRPTRPQKSYEEALAERKPGTCPTCGRKIEGAK
jgi:hypothetical protein